MKKIIIMLCLLFANVGIAQVSDVLTTQATDFSVNSRNQYTVVESALTSNFTSQIGAPQLPVFNRNYALPMGSVVSTINVSTIGKTLLGNNLFIYPAQPPCLLNGLPCPDFVAPDPAIYNSKTPFPAQTASISNDTDPFGYHVVTVTFCPFEYIPSDRMLYRFNQINITINYSVGTVEYQARISAFRNQVTKDYVKGMVQNPTAISDTDKTAYQVLDNQSATDKLIIPWKPSYNGTMPEYVVITNEALKLSFESFVNYKIKRGIPTVLVTVEDIYANYSGCDNPEKIRNYLKAAHHFWGSGLFVLLGGDTAVVPGRIAVGIHYTDLYYCDVYKNGLNYPNNYNWNDSGDSVFGDAGNNCSPDNLIGRAPVDTEAEANNFILKIVNYEKLFGVSDLSYVNNMLFLGAYFKYNHITESDTPANIAIGGQQWHKSLANMPFLANNINLKKWLVFDHAVGQPHHNFPGNEELNSQNVLNDINGGHQGIGKFHLVSHYDHGSPYGIGTSSSMKSQGIYREDMDGLSNGNEYQIMYSTACEDGSFQTDCFAEHYINCTTGGGVAIMANSASVSPGAELQDVKLFQSIYDDSMPSTYYLMGVAFANARDAISNNFNNRVLTLFGEPTMATWSATPQNIVLQVQPSIIISNTNANLLPVTIGALQNEATVTLYKYNNTTQSIEVYASQKIAVGDTTVSFTLNPDTTGNLTVMVTAKNYLPATSEVAVMMPQAHLYVSSYTVLNAPIVSGKTINLALNLTNSGGQNINNVTTLLTAATTIPATAITINNGQTNPIGSIEAGATLTVSGFSFVVQDADNLPDFIEFKLNITGDGGYSHLDNFYLPLKNPVLNLGARIVTPDGSATPVTSFGAGTYNLNVNLSNIGNVATGALTATLTSSSYSINTTEYYDSIEAGITKFNIAPFSFSFASAPASTIPFTLTLINSFGKSWTFNFDLIEPTIPKITGFHFAPKSNEIKLMWNPIAASTISGYNIYRNNSETGLYTKINTNLVSGGSFYIDTNGMSSTLLSTYYYKISVVSLSGNELPLNQVVTEITTASPLVKQGYKASTSLDFHGTFPKETMYGFNCWIESTAIAPMLYDVDGDEKKEIFSNYFYGHDLLTNGMIFGYHHDGQVIFNIDANETTVSGFAVTDIPVVSNSAIGDLDKDGHAEVLSIGRDITSNVGKLYVYKTIDEQPNDGQNKPDEFWNSGPISLSNQALRNPVLYDVDGNGFLDIIVVDEHQKVYVFDKDKNILPGWENVLVGNVYGSYGHIAVADLDHDGKAEIVLGVKNYDGSQGAIYIWNHDGTPFTVNPFKVFEAGEQADGGIVLADIDGDFNLDILAITKKNNTGKIYAFKQDGTAVNGNAATNHWTGFNIGSISDIPRIAVGNLNGDLNGNLEVVFGTASQLHVLDKDGNEVNGFPIAITNIKDSAPILADVDSDHNNIEIVINSEAAINAYQYDGSMCAGFPLLIESGKFRGSPSIDDIDNDGKNEIVALNHNAKTYVYNTQGSPSKIEWGSYRGNPRNTGTYKEVCNVNPDLCIKDNPTDIGDQPNNSTPYMWESSDIWVRNTEDSSQEHENPIYQGPGSICYIKVRVVNKSCKPYLGGGHLTLNWTKASTSLAWPDGWNGSTTPPGSPVSISGEVGIHDLFPMAAGEEKIYIFPWAVPNPADYGNDAQNWHFCLLARVDDSVDFMNYPDGNLLNEYVQNNNNVAWKNISVIYTNPGQGIEPILDAQIEVGNPFDHPKMCYLELEVADAETGNPIYEEAEVKLKMDEVLYHAWELGGKESQKLDPTLDEKRKLVKGNHVILDNLSFNANEKGHLRLFFNFLTQEMTQKTNYVYRVIQKDSDTGQIIGGETFVINKNVRPPFEADAGGVKIADLNQSITITAADINEPAIYNWYDSEGNLIFQGKELQIANAIAEKYKLEVISTVDGFKDYAEVEVKLNPNRLESIAPNPATSSTKIYYKLNDANSAYLMICSYYANVGISNNYVLDTNSNETTINLSEYPGGFYKVVLVVNGAIVDAKLLFKQ